MSFGYFASTWLIPEGTPDVVWARGNDRTCAAQGFFLQFGTASFMYNAVLINGVLRSDHSILCQGASHLQVGKSI